MKKERGLKNSQLSKYETYKQAISTFEQSLSSTTDEKIEASFFFPTSIFTDFSYFVGFIIWSINP